jgi:hypothetical protein
VSRFNHYFQNQFAGCVVLAIGRDEGRDRDVRIVALPGEFSVVGLCDGTDTWVAGVNSMGSPLIAQAAARLKMLADGTLHLTPTPGARRRITVSLDDDPPPPPRVKLVAVDEPTPRRRLNV